MNLLLLTCAIRGHDIVSEYVTIPYNHGGVVAIHQTVGRCQRCGAIVYIHATEVEWASPADRLIDMIEGAKNV